MDKQEFSVCFGEIFAKNGLQEYITDEHIEKFYALTEIMVETNRVMNITALTTPEKIIPLHYADCVMAARYIPEGATVLDVGCGGGFPILPLAIVRPDLKLTGLDSTDKKVQYVAKTAEKLGLRIKTLSGRAEELARDPAYRESFDVAISRAVARLNVLDELCLPFVRQDGLFLAMKGAAGQEEATEATAGIAKLGGKILQIEAYKLHLNTETEDRTAICIQKADKTPANYPRPFGNIKKKPL